MSAYNTYSKTKFKDAALLAAALCEVGSPLGAEWTLGTHVLVYETPVALYGYQRDKRAQTSLVTIPGVGHPSGVCAVGPASNDVGFTRDEDGNLVPLISEYDGSDNQYNDAWLGKLSAAYNRIALLQKAEEKGYTVTVEKVDGKTEYILTRWA